MRASLALGCAALAAIISSASGFQAPLSSHPLRPTRQRSQFHTTPELPCASRPPAHTPQAAPRKHATLVVHSGGIRCSEELLSLGHDVVVYLAAAVAVVPACRRFNFNPVLGYLIVGAVIGQLHLFTNPENSLELADIGILLLLFVEGLQLSFTKVKQLAKYIGLGSLQLVLTTAAFTVLHELNAPQFVESIAPGTFLDGQILS